MRLFNWIIICVVVAIVAILASGCGTTREQRIDAYKKAFTTAAKAAATAYRMGGKEAAAAIIDKKVEKGELDKDQADTLKTGIEQGINALESMAKDIDDKNNSTTYQSKSYNDRHDNTLTAKRRKLLIFKHYGKIFIC